MARIVTLVISILCCSVIDCRYPAIQPCPGEGPRYGDFKCNHDRTHRVCAQLVDNSDGQCRELSWNDDNQSFWQITGQERWNWKTRICEPPNPGDSWCICMWATENLITKVGCDNVHINCAATDIPYLLRSVSDGGWDLSTARECIKRKCPEPTYTAELQLDDTPNNKSAVLMASFHTILFVSLYHLIM